MPRPNAAQLAYGSATVICSALAMLLLSQARSGLAVAVVACVALALGLLVALTAPLPRATRKRATAVGAAQGASVPVQQTASAPTTGAPAATAPAAAGRIPETTLRR